MKRKKIILIEDYYAYKELFKDIDSFPFDQIQVDVICNKKEFEKVKNKVYDFAIIDWFINGDTGDYFYDKVKAGEKVFITGHIPPPEKLVKYCNKKKVKLIMKPILDRHIKYVLGYKVDKNKLFYEE